ncbi:Permease of the drug metabolite transporter (DMT) superfamily [Chlorella sorokiniana]|uniref:Permease of the drug metabolite transporter (DMT) superfamily n=1 Tax=Chlorella sorokiniana TaxID=3076 RepID=A0A2P6TZM8_CHLSO|nr:Permease of the drug metabolite transporter (DMT) superfamily [Chlorella sorokiniana]|eukprot:PRW59513.1 Permease of the drug metabolite transporter (DMT) superfamily [Chlorella sorokiniana]
MHFFLLVAVRSSVLCLLVLPMLWCHRVNPFAINETFPLLALRGFCGFASLSLWYLTLTLLPLSDANALSFVSPVLVAVAAPSLLGDATPPAVYLSLPFCLGGMLMVAQPTWLFGSAAGPTSQLGVAAGVLQAVFSAGSKLAIRALNKHKEPLESILFSMGFVSTAGALLGALALPGLQMAAPPSPLSWAYLAATTALAFVVQCMFTASVRHCNASTAASLDYLSLLWTLLADALVFRKLPSSLSLCGAAVISAASLGAILWTARAGSAAGAGGEVAEQELPQPLQWKRQHYLEAGGAAGRVADGSSEVEAVSLLKASSAAAAIAAKEAAAAGALSGAAEGSGIAAAKLERHAAKLGQLPEELSDSRKSWQLGTEVDVAPVAPRPRRESGGPRRRSSVHLLAGSTDGAASVELLTVAPGPAGRRTSSEKERALAAAGK